MLLDYIILCGIKVSLEAVLKSPINYLAKFKSIGDQYAGWKEEKNRQCTVSLTFVLQQFGSVSHSLIQNMDKAK